MKECARCKHINPVHAKFCMECGYRLTPIETTAIPQSFTKKIAKRAAEKRQLTILFCDLVGSTALSEQLDPETYRQVILDYHETAENVITKFRGHIAQYLGDGLLVYFGYPVGLEDAPKSAVQAGLGILEAVHQANQLWEKFKSGQV